MPARADVAPVGAGRHLSPGLWIAAAIEIGVAVGVSVIIVRTGQSSPAADPSEQGMGSMHPTHPAGIPWPAGTLALAVLMAATLTWWLATRARVPAILTAAGLVGLGASVSVRMVAVQSHVAGMAALEALMVAVPLLLVAVLPGRAVGNGPGRSPVWTAWVVLAVICNCALLIALHLPAVHDRGARLAAVPLWLALLVVAVGLNYWAAILITARRVEPGLRRGALIVGQEVGAILGLAILLGPGTRMHHTTVLGLPASLDQRLGGALMLMTCAAVTLPLLKRLESQQLRTERDVH